MSTLLSTYDALLFDLDGTVWKGGAPIPNAVETINQAATTGIGIMYITNNASNAPQVVADKLGAMNISTDAAHVMTSAQAAIELAAQHLAPGTKVLVLGTDSFRDLARAAGYEVVFSADDAPEAVFHGHNPETGWAQLSEAALAIQRGARYFASNLDATLPQERGNMVGNGSMIQAVVHATGVVPTSAGKPQPPMFHSAAAKLGATKPLGVGDRLDTDIAGGNAAGYDSLHVLTGVSGHYALLNAKRAERPSFIGADLTALNEAPEDLAPHAQGGFTASANGNVITLSGGSADQPADHLAALRTVLALAWQEDRTDWEVKAEGATAQSALEQWW
ncbi:MAG: HAD-IIA family hydrolase [Corynebacterium sp.]|nr:HAD-IIA family hydrolase [Corynebacterium sp.]